MLIQEAYTKVEEVERHWGLDRQSYPLGEPTEPYEPFTDDVGTLFRALQREHGRCVSKVYHDGADGQPIPIGWVFQKRQQYSDCADTYLQEVWVTLYDSFERRTVVNCEYHTL